MERILTDRSRMAAWQDCPRLRWNRYEWEGTGLESPTPKLALAEGIWTHQCLEGLLRGTGLDDVIAQGREELRAALSALPDAAEPHFLAEQEWMLEVLLRAWAQERLGRILAEFEVVAVEQELEWTMDAAVPPVVDMLRVDALLRQRAGGGLYYLEFKTTSSGGDEWAKGWMRNSQLLANVLAIEASWGETCEGVLIEGLVKGRRAKETAKSSPLVGKVVQQGPLCYGWLTKDESDLSPVYLPGRPKVPIYLIEDWDPQRWVSKLTEADVLASLFCPVPPILPVRAHLQRWLETAVQQEREVAQRAARVGAGQLPVHIAFPCHENHCFRYWGHPCEFEQLCFSGGVEADPLGSGLFRRRTPHHEAERANES